MTGAFRNAVELAEWLATASTEEFEEAAKRSPLGFQDQIDVARHYAIASAERRLGKPARNVEHGAISDWMRLGCYDLLLLWVAGKATTCIHQPSMESPAPCLAAAWKPGLVVCHPCAMLLKVEGDADRTCDGCGRICQGLPDDGIYPVSMIIGGLCYHAGACESCHAALLPVTSTE